MTPETLNRWRIIPRVIVALYGYTFWRVAEWFMALPDPTGPQAAFISTITGAGAAFFGLYVNSGASLKELSECRHAKDGG